MSDCSGPFHRDGDRFKDEQTELYVKIFATSPASIGIATLKDRRYCQINDGFERLIGYTAEEAVGRTARELNIEVDLDSWEELYERLREGEAIRNRQMSIRTKGGVHRFVLGSFVPIEVGGTMYVANKLVDITELRDLEGKVLEASEREQRRIGQDLHDGLAQTLYGLSMKCEVLRQQLEERSLPEEVEFIGELKEYLYQASEEARRIARGLLPAELARVGLEAGLDELAQTAEDLYRIVCRVRYDVNREADALASNQSVAVHLFRITQEAIANAVRHGQAQTVRIEVKGGDGRLLLRIIDDGCGITNEAILESNGLGLRTMRHRAHMLRGSLRIDQGAEGGTVVSCEIVGPPREGVPQEAGTGFGTG